MSSIWAVVTTFNPLLGNFRNNVRTYSGQVAGIVIADNSDTASVQNGLKALVEEFSNVTYLPMGGNKGIGAAQNAGVADARLKGARYIIEMDQDSSLSADYVHRIYTSYQQQEEQFPKILGIGSVAVEHGSGAPYDKYPEGEKVIEVFQTLSSGFFYSASVVDTVGEKMEGLFIDFVDWEWNWRARHEGYITLVDTSLTIEHSLGESRRSLLGIHFGVPQPFRHYYQYRNFLILSKLSYVPFSWKIKRTLIYLVKAAVYRFSFGDGKLRGHYVLKGVKDGLSDRSGKL